MGNSLKPNASSPTSTNIFQLGYVGGEITDARNVISRVLNNAMAVVVSLYVFANIAYIIVLPQNVIKHTDTIALVFKPRLEKLFSYVRNILTFLRTTENNCLVAQGRYSSAGLSFCHV